jgi:fumarate hydratase class II
MLVTALAPHLGYERAAAIARDAHERGMSLRDAALAAGVPGDDFDRWVVPERMARPHG